jgi:hypothetical protein
MERTQGSDASIRASIGATITTTRLGALERHTRTPRSSAASSDTSVYQRPRPSRGPHPPPDRISSPTCQPDTGTEVPATRVCTPASTAATAPTPGPGWLRLPPVPREFFLTCRSSAA